jgi:predicted phosphodiesterase
VWKNVADYFGPGYDLILYGHTHKRDERIIPGGPLVVNPGSLLAPRDGLAGMAMVELEADTRPVITWVDVDL